MSSKARDAAFAIFRPGKFLQSKADREAADKQVKNAERMRSQGLDLARQLNWEPKYVSSMLGPYQKAQSPVARSFLESMLTGANPSMVQGTRLGADQQRAAAQGAFNQQFGGWDQLEARQRAAEQATPWAVTPPSGPAVQQLPQNYMPGDGAPRAPAAPSKRDQITSQWQGLTDQVRQELERRRAAGQL